MSGVEPEPWRAWGALAQAGWRHRLELPGAELLAEVQGLDQDGDAWAWTEERVWRADGAWVLVRQTRRSDGAQDALVVLAAPSAAALVAEVDRRLGRTPGLVELLGRAGVEVGVRPDDVVEGDEIDDWPAEPPGRGGRG